MGVLDTFFGNADQTQALGLLGAGMMNGGFAQGGPMALQYLADAPNRRAREGLLNAQLQETLAQAEERKQRTLMAQQAAQRQNDFLYGAPQGAAMGGPPAQGAPAQGAPQAPMGQPTQAGGVIALARQMGIPEQAIQADIVFNGGKKIAELLDKHGSPDWQVSNGYRWNKNDGGGAGFMPFLNTSQSGQTSMGRIGPDGLPVISAPQGAASTYGTYQEIEQAAKAKYDPVTVTPAGSTTPVMRSRASVMQEANAPAPQAGMNGAFVGDPAAVSAAIAGIRDPQERANAQAAFDAQMRQTGGRLPQSGGGIALQDPTQEAARKAQLEATAKDVAEQRKAIMGAGFAAPTNIAKYQQIGKLLADVDGGKFTPTGTEVASALNSIGIKVDKNLPNKQAAMSLANEAALQLRSPAGGAGMPGALSDQDRAFLASMTPNIAQSAEGRKMVIDSYVAVQQRNQQVSQFARNYEKKYGKLDNGFFDQLQAWSNANPLFKAK